MSAELCNVALPHKLYTNFLQNTMNGASLHVGFVMMMRLARQFATDLHWQKN